MRVILECDGNDETFEKIFDSIDDEFNITDSIFYQIDYEQKGEVGIHHTEYGDIKITVED